MLDVISVDNMRRSDEYTIASFVSSEELMRRAAMGIYESIIRIKEITEDTKISIVVGSGNNGGDGFALAMILMNKCQGKVSIYSVADHYSVDAGIYKKRAEELGVVAQALGEGCLMGEDIIVDCLLGTGFKGEVRGNYKEAINSINEARAGGSYVVSADINSGLNGDTGEASVAVISDLTVTIGYHKTGILLARGKGFVNSVVVAPIGIVLLDKENYLLSKNEWMTMGFPEDKMSYATEGKVYFCDDNE